MTEAVDPPKNAGGRPRLYPDSEPFTAKVEEYFDAQVRLSKPPTMAGLCLFLGFDDRDSFSRYETYGDGFSRTVKRARLRIEADRNERLLDRADFTAGVIFDLKNNHGWKDRSAHEHSGPNGAPIQTLDLTGVSDDDLDRLEAIFGQLAVPGGDDESLEGGEGTTGS